MAKSSGGRFGSYGRGKGSGSGNAGIYFSIIVMIIYALGNTKRTIKTK